MATLGDKIVLFGGESGYLGPDLDDTWTFDGMTWSQVSGAAPSARSSANLTALGNKVVLFGGFDDTNLVSLDDTWTFDGTTWTQLSASGPPAGMTLMATLGSEIVLLGTSTWTFSGTSWTPLTLSYVPTVGNGYPAMALLP
jgi:hypothetical protein